MLVFIDESGDSGLKVNKGSSQFFTIVLLVFEENDEALACDQRIELLKRELGWTPNSEFHFKNNSNKVREVFLKAVARYNFFYYGFVLNKDPQKLWGDGFKDKRSFYKYACGLVFESAKEKLRNATVVIDESGSLEFKQQLAKYLRQKLNSENDDKVIKSVKMQPSEKNNLLQMADYVAGAVNRSISGKRRSPEDYRVIIAHREIRVQIWPPK